MSRVCKFHQYEPQCDDMVCSECEYYVEDQSKENSNEIRRKECSVEQ